MSVDNNATVIISDMREALAAVEAGAKQKPACLVILSGDLNGSVYDLSPGGNMVGRNADCTICLDLHGMSRKHFVVTVVGRDVTVTDLGSANGTYVNNRKLDGTTRLRRADVIKVGAVAMKYLPAGDLERMTYDKLQAEATTDGLTGCYNKTYFNRALELEVRRSQATGRPLTLAIFDLDHFKKLNDTHGHDAGDFVLKEKSRVVRENGIRAGDIFARYGGEEFCVLLPDTTLEQGFEIAERIGALIEEHEFLYDGKRLPVTASIGVAAWNEGVATATELFKRADAAVYRAKAGGRNQVQFFQG